MADQEGWSDKIKGKVSKIKGEVKDQVGNATEDKDMERDGKKDKAKGEFQDQSGEAKNKKKD
ncbi:CsbD family protein [Alkalicoccus chagannorensis]|uniref:CsbD family protein n=1 Tax=Alkalicoccus chagannorensis TaxID=427072 RepID=UPI0004066DFA|nr:CsbD family protein [Alkalicoccus chagannorensis]